MGCEHNNNQSCHCGANITRDITVENKSLGRDGESAYDAYVNNGGTKSYEEWALAVDSIGYSTDEW